MIGFLVCLIALLSGFFFGRRSIVHGLLAVLTAGYLYGVLRANLPGAFAHFTFDAALIGFYAARLSIRRTVPDNPEYQKLRMWLILLCGWPIILFLIPLQDPLIQAVGLRAAILFLPLIAIGARLRVGQIYRLAMGIAVLNIVVTGIGLFEFYGGVEKLYPPGPVTDIIYRSNDVGPAGNLRIPATFTSAHGYAGTMVMSLPLLWNGFLLARRRSYRFLFIGAVVASVFGVLMAATRFHFIVLVISALYLFFISRGGGRQRLILLAATALVVVVVVQQQRLRRFESLADYGLVTERLGWSVNTTFIDLLVRYPLGNGLGSGGTSIPFFLESRVAPGTFTYVENEYARILVEQGILGLSIWLAFLIWLFTRRNIHSRDRCAASRKWGRFISLVYFLAAPIGIGLLISVPQTALLFLIMGWFVVPERSAVAKRRQLARQPAAVVA